jgi:glycosidase
MTLPGMPSVYYGGEIGLEGRMAGDENRRCFPWGEPVGEDRDLRPFLKRLIGLRKSHPSFRAEDIIFDRADGGLLCYRKISGRETLFVVINNSGETKEVTLPAGRFEKLTENGNINGENGIPAKTRRNKTLPAYGYAVYISE